MLSVRATAYEFGPYRLDPLGRSLLRRGEPIALPPKAIEVLLQLVRHPGSLVRKPELIEAVWPESFVEEANLNQMIFLLRRAFGNDGGEEYIATVPRRGYRFTAGVRTVEIPHRIESIAVLPLANLSGDPAQQYFADGITEELIAELAKIRSLRVVSRTSVMRYRDSIKSDPRHASAYAAIAECFIELAYFFGMEPKQAFREAETAAVNAVTLDEKLAEGHAALSLLRLLNDWDWRAADAESDRAVALAPGDAYVYWKRGVCLRYSGRSDEAVAVHRHAEFLDPFSVVAIQEVGWALYYGRRFDEAVEQFRKAVELEPAWDQLYFGLGQTLIQQQRHDEAIAALQTAARMGPGNAFTEAALPYALGRAGRRHEARWALDQLSVKYAYVPHWFHSIVRIGLGDNEGALQSLENAFRDHEPCLVSLKVDPVFDPLRGEARFAEMVRRVGLEP